MRDRSQDSHLGDRPGKGAVKLPRLLQDALRRAELGRPPIVGLMFLSLILAGACNKEGFQTAPEAATASPGPGQGIAPSLDSRPAESGSLDEVLAKGAELYAANCQLCHGDREGKGATLGAPPHNASGHTWHHPDAQLKETIFNGKLGFGLMPPFKDKLTEREVDAVVAYIRTWWTEQQRRGQADISQRYQEALDKQKVGR